MGTTLDEIVFGFKHQKPISLNNVLYQSEFCQSLPRPTHVNKDASHSCIDTFLSSKSSTDLLNRETQSKNIINAKYIGKSEKPIIVNYRTETSTNLLNHYDLDKKSF